MSKTLSAYPVVIAALIAGFISLFTSLLTICLNNIFQKQRANEQWTQSQLYENYTKSISYLAKLRTLRRAYTYDVREPRDIQAHPGIPSHLKKSVPTQNLEQATNCYSEVQEHLTHILAKHPRKNSEEFENLKISIYWFRSNYAYLFSSDSIPDQNNKIFELENRIFELMLNDPRLK